MGKTTLPQNADRKFEIARTMYEVYTLALRQKTLNQSTGEDMLAGDE